MVSRSVPSNESSPTKTSSSILNWSPLATNKEIAIGRSNADPLFGNHAGVSETVIFRFGQTWPQFTIAALTRSFDSLRAASGKPKREKLGSPSEISISTVINSPAKPESATEFVLANVIKHRSDNQYSVEGFYLAVRRKHQFDTPCRMIDEAPTRQELNVAFDKPYRD